MFVLSRKVGQSIQIGDEITVTVKRIKGVQCRIGISAPRNIAIIRPDDKDTGPRSGVGWKNRPSS